MHRWRPIEDLRMDWPSLASGELRSLIEAWKKQRQELGDSSALARFSAELVRSWSIETGILERIYTLDEGVTRTLVEQGFDAALVPHGASDLPAGRLITILEDHREAAEGLFAYVAGRRDLASSYIRELHQVLTRHQDDCEAIDHLGRFVRAPLLKGDWKKWPNNPVDPKTLGVIHEYCPPEHVASEIDRMIDMHLTHSEVPPEVGAAWLHHRFTAIHPFQDGNGRVARVLASLVFVKARGFPVVVLRDDRVEYISALRSADAGDLRPLVALFSRIQKAALLRALGIVSGPDENPSGLAAIVKDAAARVREVGTRRQSARTTAARLVVATVDRLEIVSRQIGEQVGSGDLGFHSGVVRSEQPVEPEFRSAMNRMVVEVAARLGFELNQSVEGLWACLNLGHTFETRLFVAIHHVGRVEAGVQAAVAGVAFMDRRDNPRKGTSSVWGATGTTEPACREPYTFTVSQHRDEVIQGFTVWLEEALVIGLEAWRRKL